MLTLEQIKEKFNVFNRDEYYTIYDEFEFRGYLTKEKRTFVYHGVGEYTMKLKDMSDLEFCINDFVKTCEADWINPKAMDPTANKGFNVQLALDYIAKKFNWKSTKDGYIVASETFGAKVFTIYSDVDYSQEKCRFNVIYNGDWFSTTEYFDNYSDAMNWLKNFAGSIMMTTGLEFITSVINNNLMTSKMEDIALNKLDYSSFKTKSASLKEYMIEMLEKQLEYLRKS